MEEGIKLIITALSTKYGVPTSVNDVRLFRKKGLKLVKSLNSSEKAPSSHIPDRRGDNYFHTIGMENSRNDILELVDFVHRSSGGDSTAHIPNNAIVKNQTIIHREGGLVGLVFTLLCRGEQISDTLTRRYIEYLQQLNCIFFCEHLKYDQVNLHATLATFP